MTTTWTPEIAASGKQAHFILTLQGVAKDDDNRSESALAIVETMTKSEASALIKELLKNAPASLAASGSAAKRSPAAVKPSQTLAKPLPAVNAKEWHVFEGKFFLVAKAQGSGKLYCKMRRMDGAGGFEYSPGVLFKLSPETKVNASNVAEISAYGHLFSKCIFCSLPLDQPESITRGYGKICAGNHGLPWN